MVILAMGSRITNVKHVAANARRRSWTGALRPSKRRQIESLLRERLSLRGLCRTVGVSLTWLLHFMVECFTACPEHLHAHAPTPPTAVVMSRLEAEADEMWSFVVRRIGLVRERG